MAEVIATISVISSIIGLVDFSAKVISRINDYRSSAETIPAALKEIRLQLPLLVGDLERIKEQAEDDGLDNDTRRAVLAIVEGCHEDTQALYSILTAVGPQQGDSTWRTGQKALLSIAKYDDRIKEISDALRHHVVYLTNHLMVDMTQHRAGLVDRSLQPSTAPPRPKPSILIPFKRDAEHFVGRADLMRSLDGGFNDRNRLALVGLGGVGKSQVAIEYAYRLVEQEPDTWVFWVHVNTRARCKQSFADVARKVQLPKIEHPEHDALQEVTDWLNDKSHGRWLLIFDNCDDLDVIRNIEHGLTGSSRFGGVEEKPLIEYIPKAEHGKILATCRSRDVAMEMMYSDEQALIAVTEMSIDEARKLLRAKLPNDRSSDAEFTALADELGHIPLALKQAAAYVSLNRGHMTVSKYLRQFTKSSGSQTKLLMKEFNDESRDWTSKNSIILTWEISFNKIRSSNPSAAELLSLMSSFDRQGIPRYLLCEEEDDLDFEDDIGLLINYSLVTENSEDDNYNMHRLVQLTTQSWLETQKRQTHWWEEALKSLTMAFPEDNHDNWKMCSALLPHAQLVASRQFSSPSSDQPLSELFRKGGVYDMGQGRYEAAHQRLTASYYIRQRPFGEEHASTLDSLNALGSVLEREGHWREAETTHRKTLAIRRRLYGDSDVQTLEAENSLCLDLIDEGEYDEAEILLRQALDLEKSLDNKHHVRLDSMTYLGLVLEHQGRFLEAADIYRSVLEMQDQFYSSEHPATLETVNHLGRTLSVLGLWTEAASMLARAHESKSEVLGPEHPKTLDALSALIDNQERQGKLKEVAKLPQNLIDLQDRVFGHDHPTTLESLNHLANIKITTGLYAESMEILEDALRKNVQNAGPEHPLSLRIRRNIGKCWKDSTDEAKGAEIEKEVLEIQERTLGPDNPDTIQTVCALAESMGLIGSFAEAHRLINRAIVYNIEHLGRTHAQTLISLETQAFVLQQEERWEDSAQAYRQLVRTEEEIFGLNHPTTLQANHNLGFALAKSGTVEKASRLNNS
ncbi:Uu.00g100390.m01.CDS01 [Anthostomella pinea]|uniref:Uu.00g100390.m01.CDS01 n=1 Tax=Anthostomella pinea TaxID=933095 RepID=A0AAI8VCV0_9PEZI|nr:Uu.00g100390.m01.CDS01 [Anthostomella pinea]